MKFLVGCFSSRIVDQPFLERVIELSLVHQTIFNLKKVTAYIGWGKRPNTWLPRLIAKKTHIPFVAIEDGFLRSFKPGRKFPSISYVFDRNGIFYDHTCSSDLEKMLSSKKKLLMNKTFIQSLMQHILQNKISKYNHAPNLLSQSLLTNRGKKVLVIDQTLGDMSVVYGSADARSFLNMFDAAQTENPSATIYVKTHPEVTSRRKKGYLTHIQEGERVVIIRDDVNPIDLIEQVDKVYVVTSQIGFEALICGKPVVIFGVPWYAGWGLTDDRVKDSPAWARRTKKRSVDELFAAAYIHYTRYLNPFTHQRGTIFDVIDWLILQKKMASRPFTRDFGVSTHKLLANA